MSIIKEAAPKAVAGSTEDSVEVPEQTYHVKKSKHAARYGVMTSVQQFL